MELSKEERGRGRDRALRRIVDPAYPRIVRKMTSVLVFLLLVAAALPHAAAALRFLDASKYPVPAGQPPPQSMPPHLTSAFTRNNTIPLLSKYVDDTLGGLPRPQSFGRREVEGIMKQTTQLIDRLRKTRSRFVSFSAFVTTLPQKLWLLATLIEFEPSIKGKRAVVFGSARFLEESYLLVLGAASVTVLDYQPLSIEHPQVTTMLVKDARRQYCEASTSRPSFDFDIAISASSFDHDGLGRYGDPLSPDGDLLAMDEVKCSYLSRRRDAEAELDARGETTISSPPLLFLTLPIGPDAVVWNLHRRYGSIRLPLMLAGYDQVLDPPAGWNATLLEKENVPATRGPSFEPVMVLRPTLAARTSKRRQQQNDEEANAGGDSGGDVDTDADANANDNDACGEVLRVNCEGL